MLDILPVEISLVVLSYLPIPSLCSLPTLSRQWYNFFSKNQSTIFHEAAILHEYTQPGTLLLEDALSVYTGSPWEGATDWKDYCRRFVQLRKNWEGNGRVVARMVTAPRGDVHRIKVDEKARICITTRMSGGLYVTHLFSNALLWSLPPYYIRPYAHCEYENGYLVFDRIDGKMEVWCLASDFAVGEVATHSPPDERQRFVSAFSATKYHLYAPRGHFRPWAMLSFPAPTNAYRFAYPTLLCASETHAFLHDVRSGRLVQTIEMDLEDVCYVDVNERHAFVCEPTVLHVYSRDNGAEVLQIPSGASVSHAITAALVPGDAFVEALPLLPGSDDLHPSFVAAHVSRDGRDLVILSTESRALLVRDFERICRGEITLEEAGQALRLLPGDICYYLAFEHGRICVATSYGLYIFIVGGGPSIDSIKLVFVRPFLDHAPVTRHGISCMQLTDRRIYFTWEDSRRRDVPFFEEEVNAPETSSTSALVGTAHMDGPWVINLLNPRQHTAVGCIDFSLLPES
ncbi:hypothetical protein BJV74DRAFT_554300 [Russula compacta]|nr:hypothetical protein BJV74DRAFT_554300 [Russula compacta]